MVSPEDIDKHQPENPQAPSSAEGKQGIIEHIRLWLKTPRRTLGTALSLLVGIAWTWCILSLDLGLLVLLVLLAVGILAGVCVVLFSTSPPWPVGIVSLAFAFGELLTFFILVSFHSTWQGYTATATFGVLVPFGVAAGFFVAFVGAYAGYGYAISKLL